MQALEEAANGTGGSYIKYTIFHDLLEVHILYKTVQWVWAFVLFHMQVLTAC